MGVVTLLGDLNWDLVLAVPRLPQRGGEVLSAKAALRLGGSAANTARWLARLGFEARLFAAVGVDPLGDLALAELAKDGVFTGFIRRYPENTGLCCAFVDAQGERTLITSRGANSRLSPPLPEGWLEGAHWLHISGYALLEESSRAAVEEALARAWTRGIPVSLDPGMVAVHGHQGFLRGIGPVDVFLPNREEAVALVGTKLPQEMLPKLEEFGRRVFLKLGAEGCLVGEGGRAHRVPAIAVDVGDPVGAGDAFNAGVIAASIWGGSLLVQAALGNLLGALAAAGIPLSSQAVARLIQALPEQVRTELQGLLAVKCPICGANSSPRNGRSSG